MLVACAEQLAVVPPFDPIQLHDHGPEPETEEAVPLEQRLFEGAELRVVPLEEPQAPLTAVGAATLKETDALPEIFPAVSEHFT